MMFNSKFFFFMCTCCALSLKAYSLPTHYTETIADLVANNPHQLSIREYSLIAENLLQRGPCNMLIFGVGRDSALWMNLNEGGTTIFLEDNLEWLKYAQDQLPDIQAYLVEYHSKRSQWKMYLEARNYKKLYMNLPEVVMNTKWDIIFVDGPAGNTDSKPGRMKSIYMASLLAHQGNQTTDVFVHDCDRQVEAVYCTTFLGDENLQMTIDRLRFYKIL